MKGFLHIIVCLTFCNSFSQVVFEKMPGNTKKIHFVYEEKSNYFINENGVYADTLLMKIDFPNLKYTLKKHPKDSTILCGFSTFKGLGEKNNEKLRSILYHNNETIYGTVDLKKNITTLNYIRDDYKTKELFKKVFNENYNKFEYTIEIDYNRSKIYYSFPSVDYKKRFDDLMREVIFYDDSKLYGHYFRQTDLYREDNLVTFDKSLDKKINMDLIFNNNEYGLSKHISVFSTIELKSVKYE